MRHEYKDVFDGRATSADMLKAALALAAELGRDNSVFRNERDWLVVVYALRTRVLTSPAQRAEFARYMRAAWPMPGEQVVAGLARLKLAERAWAFGGQLPAGDVQLVYLRAPIGVDEALAKERLQVG